MNPTPHPSQTTAPAACGAAPARPLHVLALSLNTAGWMYETLCREQQALASRLEAVGGKVTFAGPGFDYTTNDVSQIVEAMTRRDDKLDAIICYINEQPLIQPLRDNWTGPLNIPEHLRRFPVGLDKITDIPKVLWINDFWHMSPEQWDKAILGHGFTDVLATYTPPYLSRADFEATYSPTVRERVTFHALPRGADTARFFDDGRERDIDVTLLGAMDSVHPLRQRFHETLSHQTWFSYMHKPHPGYDFQDKLSGEQGLFGDAYAEALRRTKAFVSCTGTYKVPFIKISEVLASGAVLVCDQPSGAKTLGLVDGETYVQVDDATLLPRLRELLHDDDTRQAIAKRGHTLAMGSMTAEHNAQRVTDSLETIIDRGCTTAPTPIKTSLEPQITINGRGWLDLPRKAWRRSKAAAKALRGDAAPTRVVSPDRDQVFEPIKGGSHIDWAWVSEYTHILNLARIEQGDDLRLIEKFGLNQFFRPHPVITQNPEVISARPVFMRKLALHLDARYCGEVGTARGMQSIFWARTLEQRGLDPATSGVWTCDLIGMDRPIFHTPLSEDRVWTRAELWEDTPETSRIDFCHGDSNVFHEHLKQTPVAAHKFDLVYIDGAHTEDGVIQDYRALLPYFDQDTVLVFDDCDARFPGVERAVMRIARERNQQLQLIQFWPSAYCVTLLGCPLSLRELGKPVSTLLQAA